MIGNDVAITMAAEAGQLQLNAFEPIILHSLSESLMHLTNACTVLGQRRGRHLRQRGRHVRACRQLHRPGHGVESTSGISDIDGGRQRGPRSGRSAKNIVLERGYLTAEQLTQALQPERLANPR